MPVHPLVEGAQALGSRVMYPDGCELAVHEEGCRYLLHPLVAELGALHVPSNAYAPEGTLDLASWGVRRRPRPKVVDDAVEWAQPLRSPLTLCSM